MHNPFELLEKRLSNIETILLDLKHQPKEVAPTEHPDQLLTIQQAAELLSLTVPTLYTKVSKGELPSMKRGKRLYFSRAELLDYIKAGRKKSNAEVEAEAESYLSQGRV